MKFRRIVLVAIAAAFAASAQSTGKSPFIGTWELDVAKSKVDPGPPMKSETVTIAEDGKVTVQSVDGKGKSENWSYTYMEDQEAPITGMQNSSVVEKRHGKTVEHAWKFDGGTFTGKGVISKNGKVMTYTLDGTNSEGKHEHSVSVYEKQ